MEVARQEIVQIPAVAAPLQNVMASELIVPCKIGPSNVQYLVANNTSEGSTSQMQFKPPVAPNMILDTKFLLSAQVAITFSFTNNSLVAACPINENARLTEPLISF